MCLLLSVDPAWLLILCPAPRAEIAIPRGSSLVCLYSIPARTRGMSHSVRRLCAGHEYGLAPVYVRQVRCQLRGFFGGVQLRAFFTVATLAGIQIAAAIRTYAVRFRFAHVSTSYPAAAASSLSQSCCSSRRRYFLRTRYFLACL